MKIPVKKLVAKAIKWLVVKVGDELEEEFEKQRQAGVGATGGSDSPPPPRIPRPR